MRQTTKVVPEAKNPDQPSVKRLRYLDPEGQVGVAIQMLALGLGLKPHECARLVLRKGLEAVKREAGTLRAADFI